VVVVVVVVAAAVKVYTGRAPGVKGCALDTPIARR
jgi:hypothetical protein